MKKIKGSDSLKWLYHKKYQTIRLQIIKDTRLLLNSFPKDFNDPSGRTAIYLLEANEDKAELLADFPLLKDLLPEVEEQITPEWQRQIYIISDDGNGVIVYQKNQGEQRP